MKVFDDDGMFTPEAEAIVRKYAAAVVEGDDEDRSEARDAAPEPVRHVLDDLDVSMALAMYLAEV